MEIRGKTALITGGGTGIGRAIALQLAHAGANIAINYSRSRTEAEDTLHLIRDLGVKGEIYQADVSNNKQIVEMCKQIEDDFGTIDILINNAGTTHFVPLHELDELYEEHWDDVFNVNVKGVFMTSRACAQQLKLNKGCIVNITSIAGMIGRGSSIAYAASKAAAISVTKSLALVLAPEVRVNSIAPGIVITRWVDGHEDHVEKYGNETPLGRVAYPEDVAEMALALIQGGDFVTGQTIVVDGGKTI